MTYTFGNIVAIIPARGGSKGIRNKNIRNVAGSPLISYAIKASRSSKYVSKVIVSSDDATILSIAEKYGAKGIVRPQALATDEASSESALLHVLDVLEEQSSTPEHILFIQCTSPLITAEQIDKHIEQHFLHKADSSFSAVPFHHFLWQRNETGAGIGINHDSQKRLPRQAIKEPTLLESGASYLLQAEGFRKAKHRFFGRIVPVEISDLSPLEIDCDQELIMAEALLRERNRKNLALVLPDKTSALVLDFDGVFTDNTVYTDLDGNESVRCHRGDGMGLAQLQAAGVKMIVLSKEQVPVATARCKKLNIPCFTGIDDKPAKLTAWADEHSIPLENICYLGNDVNDISCMQRVGCSIAVADAHPTVLPYAQIILNSNGGRGAIRELTDLILTRKNIHA